jgi:hypothetical protein
MLGRRKFLLGGLAVVVVAGVGVVAVGPAAARAKVAAIVRRRLSFLKLDEAGLQAFAYDQVSDLLAKRPTWNRWKYHFLSAFSKSFMNGRWNTSTDRRTRSERLADNLSSLYLLSSDFFLNHADESRVVKYVSLYDPMRPCGNPFARPPVDIPA